MTATNPFASVYGATGDTAADDGAPHRNSTDAAKQVAEEAEKDEGASVPLAAVRAYGFEEVGPVDQFPIRLNSGTRVSGVPRFERLLDTALEQLRAQGRVLRVDELTDSAGTRSE